MVRKGNRGQDDENITARVGQTGWDNRDKRLGQDIWDRTTRTGQDGQVRSIWTGLPDRSVWIGEPERTDRNDQDRSGRSGQVNLDRST
jgi:hypothetical protein